MCFREKGHFHFAKLVGHVYTRLYYLGIETVVLILYNGILT